MAAFRPNGPGSVGDIREGLPARSGLLERGPVVLAQRQRGGRVAAWSCDSKAFNLFDHVNWGEPERDGRQHQRRPHHGHRRRSAHHAVRREVQLLADPRGSPLGLPTASLAGPLCPAPFRRPRSLLARTTRRALPAGGARFFFLAIWKRWREARGVNGWRANRNACRLPPSRERQRDPLAAAHCRGVLPDLDAKLAEAAVAVGRLRFDAQQIVRGRFEQHAIQRVLAGAGRDRSKAPPEASANFSSARLSTDRSRLCVPGEPLARPLPAPTVRIWVLSRCSV